VLNVEGIIQKKVLLLCAASKMVLHFRTDLIKALQKNSCEVSVVAFDDKYQKEIEALGVDFYCAKDNNRSLSILKIITLESKYKRIIKKVNPDIVFTFMLKPNIFGASAAKKAKVKRIFCMVEGAGHGFTHKSFKWKLVRYISCIMYKRAFKKADGVFFLNEEDKQEFIERKLVKEEKSIVVHGIGVNTEHFGFSPVKFYNSFLMVARLTESKGVKIYCKAAREIKKKYPDARFGYLGQEGSLDFSEIQEYIDDKSLNYYGETDDVRKYLDDCSVFVLPSYYREGLPMSIMEAMSKGRAIITTDNFGCRDTVKDGYNGFLVPVKNVKALVEKMEYCLLNPEKVSEMGKNSRTFVLEKFEQSIINDKIIKCVLQ
jgi:glycosyltransferase involved in cell wall biosynthesis